MLVKQILRESGTYAQLVAPGGSDEIQPYQIGIASNTKQLVWRDATNEFFGAIYAKTQLSTSSVLIVNGTGYGAISTPVITVNNTLSQAQLNGTLIVNGTAQFLYEAHHYGNVWIKEHFAIGWGNAPVTPNETMTWNNYAGGIEFKIQDAYYNTSMRLITMYHKPTMATSMLSGFGAALNARVTDEVGNPVDIGSLRFYWQTPPGTAFYSYAQAGIWVAATDAGYAQQLVMTWDTLLTGEDHFCLSYATLRVMTGHKIEGEYIRSLSTTSNLLIGNFLSSRAALTFTCDINTGIEISGGHLQDTYGRVVPTFSTSPSMFTSGATHRVAVNIPKLGSSTYYVLLTT